MSVTGLATFDKSLQTIHSWLNELEDDLGWADKHKTFQGLRVVLHALRDRLSVEQATKLAAQFPVLLAGFYYENWQPTGKPIKTRHKEAFLAEIQSELEDVGPDIDAEQVVRAVFKLVAHRVSAGEVDDVKNMFPKHLKALWPVVVPS